ncbi:MAG: hypothetical protein GU359_07805 [Desulfurococcales archaeon]|nr:hypothetical protein [Desulfurococcales archaeon]MCC6062684.1 hypothetical protein [Desulfurococcales archaeon]MCI4456807.1 hypothetical protein [Desulfurococcaceae archaeon]NAZ14028.1 hypothetical protein [Desulfurococcales archaeon]
MSQQPTKSKDLKIIARPVITIDQLKNNSKALRLLHLIYVLNKISEKNLLIVLKELKELGLDLGYELVSVVGNVVSKDLKEDLTALLYLGLLETRQQNRILSLTSLGKEFLEKNLDKEFLEKVKSKIEEIKPKISILLAESEMKRR